MSELIEVLRPIAVSDPSRVEIGPKQLYWVPLDAARILPQQRTRYDEDELRDLENSLVATDDEGGFKVELIHPPTLNFFRDEQEARRYIDDLNECFELDLPADTIQPYSVNGVDVRCAVIAGHRRMMALRKIVKDREIDPSKVDISFSVKEGWDFASAIDLQYRENEHRRLTPWQDARAIQTRYKIGVGRGEFGSFSDCAKHLGIPAERVARAWKFDQLPKFIRDEVRDSKTRLTYGKAVYLYSVGLEHTRTMLEHYIAKLPMQDGERERAMSGLNSASLGELVGYLDEDERDRYEFQLRLARRVVANAADDETSALVNGLVSDIRDSKVDLMQPTEVVSARDRARMLRQVQRERTKTYGDLSHLLMQLLDDAATIQLLNENNQDDGAVLRMVHTPRARRVLRDMASLLGKIDGVVPDDIFRKRLSHEIGALLMGLHGLDADTALPDVLLGAIPQSGGQQTIFGASSA